MKKLFRYVVLLFLLTAFILGSVACSGTNGSTTEIVVMNFGGGGGTAWIENAANEFAEKVKDVEFESGKKGVSFDFTHSTNTQISTMKTSGFNMYFDERVIDIKALSAQGLLMDITDVVNAVVDTRNGKDVTILDKIDVDNRTQLMGNDGKYYGLPHYAIYPGLTYDVELFDRRGLYFADPDETEVVTYQCNLVGKTARFVKPNTDAEKSCGNDGVKGTQDDGLPTSLEELIMLCDYMKKKCGVYPFTFTGWHSDYSNILVEALWTNLAGYNQMRTNYTFNGDVEVVRGYTDENLFSGINYIKKPQTEVVKVTEKNGYEVSGMVAKYYAIAFEEIAFKQDWFSKDAFSETVSHVDAQGNFIWSGVNGKDEIGMLIDGNHWYNESVTYGNFQDYYAYTGATERNIAWMSIPTSLDQSVTKESEARSQVILDVNRSYCVINGNIKKEGVAKACKEFLKFLYTDAQLEKYTQTSGLMKAKIDYTVTKTDEMSDFLKSIIDLHQNNKILYQTADNDRYNTFYINFSAPTVQPVFDVRYNACFLAIKNNKTAKEIFEQLRMSSGQWN